MIYKCVWKKKKKDGSEFITNDKEHFALSHVTKSEQKSTTPEEGW